ncbi:hypothetical protein ACHQM5_007094 [Ranunculus cassubicifolius]
MVSIKDEDEDQEEQNHQQIEEEYNPKMEAESSPLRSPLHLASKKPFPQREPPHLHENLSQIIAKDRKIHGFSPLRSPENKKPIQQPPPQEPVPQPPVQVNNRSPAIVVNRSIREELSKVDSGRIGGESGSRRVKGGDVEADGGDRRSRTVSAILLRERKEARLRKTALGFRVCAFVFSLISFSVMAADKTVGWAGDSFDRYKEYRYCLSVNVIGFAYAAFQMVDLSYYFMGARHVIQGDIRYYFDFVMDQILTYLLISASSAAASRIDEWQSNWGKDDFTVMASASVGMSFLAFIAFAFNSLISGYNICNRGQT